MYESAQKELKDNINNTSNERSIRMIQDLSKEIKSIESEISKL